MKYAAFVRGIGPGDPRKSNESLRSVFESLGYTNVRSFISSGNILFESPEKGTEKLEREIEQAFERAGFTATTFVKSREELEEFVSSNPFGDMKHTRETYLTVTFLRNATESDMKELESTAAYRILLFDKALGAVCAIVNTTVGKTPEFMGIIEKHFGKEITTRTFNTIARVVTKL